MFLKGVENALPGPWKYLEHWNAAINLHCDWLV